MNFWAPEKAENFLISRAIFSLSELSLLYELRTLTARLLVYLL
jgi:hypothetical protein